mmetsp:Transcript_103772/g.300156  ORF Transcript_103772/g.300156 Transcript_103772/m.300156 type:complete len:338 (+) Transcript_103772:111-1124(+)
MVQLIRRWTPERHPPAHYDLLYEHSLLHNSTHHRLHPLGQFHSRYELLLRRGRFIVFPGLRCPERRVLFASPRDCGVETLLRDCRFLVQPAQLLLKYFVRLLQRMLLSSRVHEIMPVFLEAKQVLLPIRLFFDSHRDGRIASLLRRHRFLLCIARRHQKLLVRFLQHLLLVYGNPELLLPVHACKRQLRRRFFDSPRDGRIATLLRRHQLLLRTALRRRQLLLRTAQRQQKFFVRLLQLLVLVNRNPELLLQVLFRHRLRLLRPALRCNRLLLCLVQQLLKLHELLPVRRLDAGGKILHVGLALRLQCLPRRLFFEGPRDGRVAHLYRRKGLVLRLA